MKWTSKLEDLFRNKRNNTIDSKNNTSNKQTEIENTSSPIPIDFKLNALVISDGHGCLSESDIPDGDFDVCFLLGDFSRRDIDVIKNKTMFIPTYGVLGNHDGFELYDMCGIENIHGKVVEVNGIKIAGIQGSLRYKDAVFPLYTDDESVAIADNMDMANILISHDGPKYFHGDKDWAHSGLQGVRRYCERYNVPLNIHGHFHDDVVGILENGTRTICCYGARIILVSSEGVIVESQNKIIKKL